MQEEQASAVGELDYRGKHFTVPTLSAENPIIFSPCASNNKIVIPTDHLVITDLNKPFDLKHFKNPRKPISLGILPDSMAQEMAADRGVDRTLDMPILMPGTDVRLPGRFGQIEPLLRLIFDYEAAINPQFYKEYYCYLTFDQRFVKAGTLQREAPCHVDGFQGARWKPKHRGNHSYTISNLFPTAYYPQVFDFDQLDDTKHNFFWEMNRQVALTNSANVWYPQPFELTLMDCYSVHRGTEATYDALRVFIRVSFETRIFDRLGNAHNPLFDYEWEMVPRDIEQLNLVAFDETSDPSLRVFPHQDLNGNALPKGVKTKPNLKPQSQS